VLDRLMGLAVGAGVRKGLLGGRRVWLALGIVAYGFRTVRRLAERRPEVVYRAKLDPGQSLLVEHQSVRYGDER